MAKVLDQCPHCGAATCSTTNDGNKTLGCQNGHSYENPHWEKWDNLCKRRSEMTADAFKRELACLYLSSCPECNARAVDHCDQDRCKLRCANGHVYRNPEYKALAQRNADSRSYIAKFVGEDV